MRVFATTLSSTGPAATGREVALHTERAADETRARGAADRARKELERMKVTGDVGPQVLKFLFDALKIDDAWALREPRSFTW
jgi:hypothetical protein